MSSDLRRTIAAALGLTLAAALGCGKQGPPLPPLRTVPAAAQDLHVRQQGTRALFELSYPKTTAGGMALDGISAVEVWEAVQPAPREGKPLPVDARVFTASAKQVFKVADTDLGSAVFGDKLIFSYPLPGDAIVAAPAATPAASPPAAAPTTPSTTPSTPSTAPPPTTTTPVTTTPSAVTAPATPTAPAAPRSPARFYAVRTVGKNGKPSDFSNQVSLIPKTPPAAPDQVTTTARPDGVLVEWTPVEGALGFAIYRRGAQEKGHGVPVHAAGPTERSWLDNTARYGQSYIYAVTSFNDRDPFIESSITSEREVRYQDRFAPPLPTDLVALGESGRIRLVWKGSDAEDLVGYIVYRRDAAGDFQRITAQPLTAAEYNDTGVKPGTAYSYRVTAVDQTGNESAPSNEVRASLP